MKGYIYIASCFQRLHSPSSNKLLNQAVIPIDNDPDFRYPFTWGICRPDLREKVKKGDTIFFVLPKRNNYQNMNQMIFAYITVKEIITHKEAYNRKELYCKRMTNKIVGYIPFSGKFSRYLMAQKGNIIVDKKGEYNPLDKVHSANFDRIKTKYVIADMSKSKLLTIDEITKLSKSFLQELIKVTKKTNNNSRVIDILSRYGFTLKKYQVNELINWIN